MMLTQTVKPVTATSDPMGSGASPLNATETVLRNLRVLATDQTTETEVAANGKTVVKIAHDVTLEVTPRIAEKIEVAQTLGTLSLALRSLADDQADLDRATAVTASARQTMPGAKYPGEGATTYSTGGDVSRFARRSLPAAGPARRGPIPALATLIGPTVKVTRGNSETAVPIGYGLGGRLPGPPGGMQPMQSAMIVGGE